MKVDGAPHDNALAATDLMTASLELPRYSPVLANGEHDDEDDEGGVQNTELDGPLSPNSAAAAAASAAAQQHHHYQTQQPFYNPQSYAPFPALPYYHQQAQPPPGYDPAQHAHHLATTGAGLMGHGGGGSNGDGTGGGGARDHVCETCSKGFTTAQALKSHRRLHTLTRDHVCGACGKRFLRSQDLERHMSTHLSPEEFLFRCGCGKGFKRRDAIARHVKLGRCENPVMPPAMKRGVKPKDPAARQAQQQQQLLQQQQAGQMLGINLDGASASSVMAGICQVRGLGPEVMMAVSEKVASMAYGVMEQM